MTTEKRNILVVMADQFHAKAMSCMNHPVAKTPNLDIFAAEGVLFTNAFTSCPLCQPARISMLTGMYPHATQIYDNNLDRGSRPDIVSMAAYLHEHGYFTGTTGKYHADALSTPGFDLRIKMSEYTDFLRSRGKEFATDYLGPSFEDFPSPSIGCGVAPLEDGETRTSFEADCALRFLERRDKDKPFFLWMNFDAPHGPYYLSEKYAALYDPDSIPITGNSYAELPPEQQAWIACRSYDKMDDATLRKALAFYYGSISEVDFHFGRIIKRLCDLGLYDDTIIVFLADHGDHAGDHRLVNKSFSYDSTLRIPFIVHVPGTAKSGRLQDFVQNVDLFPTFCDLLGLPKPEMLQGHSFAGIFAPELKSCYCPRPYVFSDEYYYRTIRTSDFKLIYAPPHITWGDDRKFTPQLYDLILDPMETRNRYDDPECEQVKTHLLHLLLDALCMSELPLAPYARQQITGEEHALTYGSGYDKMCIRQRNLLRGVPSPIRSEVYLKSEGLQGWANGG